MRPPVLQTAPAVAPRPPEAHREMNDAILLIDDDPSVLMLVEHELGQEGLQTLRAVTAAEGLELLARESPAAVVLDLGLPDRAGNEVLTEIRERFGNTPVVVLTARGEIEAVVECMQLGAIDFVQKPFDRTRLVTSVRNALEQSRLRRRLAALTQELRSGEGMDAILGSSQAMKSCIETLTRAARSDVSVLLQGESGTGKELAARAVHAESNRSTGPFVPVNCGAIPEGLIESQLFGHEKGAFTGATGAHPGFFEQADGGTIFLDEIGELRADLQVRLLRVLQERVVQRVGSAATRPIDVRVVAATNVDIDARMASGDFREDLYYRLAVFPVTLPPLRERDDDVVFLAHLFLQRFAKKHDRPATEFTEDARTALAAYGWPGNVRQLENVIERAVILEDGDRIGLGSLPEDVVCALEGPSSEEPNAAPQAEAVTPHPTEAADSTELSTGSMSLEENERRLIDQALTASEGNVTAAANLLGIGRATLYRRIERHGFQDRLQRGRRT